MPDVFGIADDILVAGYSTDGKDHDDRVQRVLQRCREVNLKLNKEKCHVRCTSLPFFGEVISRNGVQPDPHKVSTLVEMPPPNNKKELLAFLGIFNNLGKFSPRTVAVCKPLHKLTSSKVVWTWNTSYQAIYDKVKWLIKANACMKFNNENKPFYLETDASRQGLVTALQQMGDGATYQRDTAPDNITLWLVVFASKSLISAEYRYCNIEREALGILHGLEKFHHNCFARDITVINDHKPLVAIFKKDVAMLSVPENPVHHPKNPSVQDKYNIQTRTRNFYCRLAVLIQPWGE